MDINHITNGKIAERWHEYDALGMMQQLGVIPAMDSPARKPGGDDASRTSKEASPTSPEENKALIWRYWQEASTRRLPVVMEEFLAPDVVSHPPASASAEPIRGLDAFKQFIAAQFGAFPDMAVTVEDLIAEGDRVAARVTTRGTHAGELIGLPPTGRRVEWSGISMTRHAGGKIVEQWGEFDALGLLQQLSGDALSAPGTDGGFTATPEEAGQLYERRDEMCRESSHRRGLRLPRRHS
jgi:predicted ester cyclase